MAKTELTAEEKIELEAEYKVWVKKMLCTDPADREMAERGMRTLVRLGGGPLQEIIWVNGPLHLLETLITTDESFKGMDRADALQKACGATQSIFYGQHGGNWWWCFNFLRKKLGLTLPEEFNDQVEAWCQIADSTGQWLAYGKRIYAQERPQRIALDDRGRLHYDGGPALLFRDGLGVYMWHGVAVPKWLIETPADKLDVDKIMKLQNVEERAAGVQKVGPERMEKCMTVLDEVKSSEWGKHYWLMELRVLDSRPRRCLKMQNPSLPPGTPGHEEGKLHYEWVEFECNTVQDAINMRAKRILLPGQQWHPIRVT